MQIMNILTMIVASKGKMLPSPQNLVHAVAGYLEYHQNCEDYAVAHAKDLQKVYNGGEMTFDKVYRERYKPHLQEMKRAQKKKKVKERGRVNA